MKLDANELYTLERVRQYCEDIDILTKPRGRLSGLEHRAAVKAAALTLYAAVGRLLDELEKRGHQL